VVSETAAIISHDNPMTRRGLYNLDPLVQKNITLQGSFSHNWPIWERVIALLASGALDVRPIIGGVWPLEKWHEAFEKMHSGAVVKSVLAPSRA